MCDNFPTVQKHRQIRPDDRLSEIASTSEGHFIPENGKAEHGVMTPGSLTEETLVPQAFRRELKNNLTSYFGNCANDKQNAYEIVCCKTCCLHRCSLTAKSFYKKNLPNKNLESNPCRSPSRVRTRKGGKRIRKGLFFNGHRDTLFQDRAQNCPNTRRPTSNRERRSLFNEFATKMRKTA